MLDVHTYGGSFLEALSNTLHIKTNLTTIRIRVNTFNQQNSYQHVNTYNDIGVHLGIMKTAYVCVCTFERETECVSLTSLC